MYSKKGDMGQLQANGTSLNGASWLVWESWTRACFHAARLQVDIGYRSLGGDAVDIRMLSGLV